MQTKSGKMLTWATRASVAVALILLVVKLYAWFVTGSMGILAALVDSLLDLGASIINLLAVRYSLMPADDEHRFGHGKAESLAGLAQSIFIASSAIFLMMYTLERVVNPELIESPDVGVWVMIFSMFLTILLVAYQRKVVKETGSVAIKADSLHYATDLITNLGILGGLLLYYMGWLYADPVIAFLIGLYIFKCSAKVAYDSVQLLLDRELPKDEQDTIHTLTMSHPAVIEVHDIRTRQSGQTKFIQLHLVMDRHLSLLDAHTFGDEVLAIIKKEYPEADILIHQDPDTEREGEF